MTTAAIFDTETTDRKEGEIIEAALIVIPPEIDLAGESDRIELTQQRCYLNVERFQPSKPMSFGAMAIHGILPHELEGCRPSADFRLPDDCAYIVGHSIDFDWEAAGKPNVKRICTHAMAQWVWPEATGYSLVALTYLLLGPTRETRELVRGAHGAKKDCELTLGLLRAILAERPSITTWSALWEFSEECRIPRTCPLKRWDGVLLEDMEDGSIDWCLRQDWLDEYFRKGLNRVLDKRYPPRPTFKATLGQLATEGAE